MYLWHQQNKLASVGWLHLGAKTFLILLLLTVNASSLKYTIDTKNEGITFVWLAAPIAQLISTVRLGQK